MIELFTTIANQVGVSASLLISVCTAETGLRNVNNFGDANGRGSLGICQVGLPTAREQIKHVDALAMQQVRVNIRVAAIYLKKLERTYTSYPLIIAAYNMGHVKINRNGQLVNREYVDKVMTNMGLYD